MEKKTLQIKTIHECNCCLGNKTWHPLVSAIDLSKAHWEEYSIKFDFYVVLLIENECDDFTYGRKYYDYSCATLVFLPPGQSIQMDGEKPFPRNGWLLAFHPRLLCDTSLGAGMNNYTFFSYNRNEALHLSLREKTKVTECLANVEQELRQAIDRHSRVLVSRHIELLLDYCSRFYERQFILRDEVNNQLLDRLDSLLDGDIESGKLKNKTLPSPEYCSGFLGLSAGYFNDLLKFKTGKTLAEYLLSKRIKTAQQMLQGTDQDICSVAAFLGFSNVRNFSRLFQKTTGMPPEEYKPLQN